MSNYGFWTVKHILHHLFVFVLFFLNLIYISQCWTAAPSSLPFKSFYWSTSSCVDSSRATRQLHYKRYIVSVFIAIYWILLYFICGNVQKTQSSKIQKRQELNFVASHKKCKNFHPWMSMWRWTLAVLSAQISQVCQLCQQSPRLFTNHAAQLHTLLVSILNLNLLWHMIVQLV